MKRLHILLIVSSLGVGGMENFALQLFREIDKKRFQIDFLIFDKNRTTYMNEVIEKGGNVYIYDGKSKFFINEIAFIYKVLRCNNYDIIHINSCSLLGMIKPIIAAKFNRTKIITHSHSVGNPTESHFDKHARRLMKFYVSNSVDLGFACSEEAGKSKYTNSFIKSQRFLIVNNAISVDKYVFRNILREKKRQALSLDNKDIVIGTVGRLEKEKNHEFLIHMMKNTNQKNIKLMIIGEGSLRHKLEKIRDEMTLQNEIIFTGNRNDVNELYNVMDIFVLPSLYEGFPYVLVEAQMNGLKCIVSDRITKNVNISNEVEFLDIDSKQSTELWKEAIFRNNKKRISVKSVEKVINEYDIEKEIRKIEHKYLICASRGN